MSSSWDPNRDPSPQDTPSPYASPAPYEDPYGPSSAGSSYPAPTYGQQQYGQQQYGQAPYGQQQWGAQPGYGYPAGPPASGLAIASLVCGILGVVSFGFSLTWIPAVICGHLAWGETSSGRASGHGMTIAGLILGYLVVVLGGVTLLFVIFAAVAASGR